MTPHELRATLDRLDLSAAEAGHLLGVHRATVYRWLDGSMSVPKASVSRTGRLTKPRTVKQKAKRFQRWREKRKIRDPKTYAAKFKLQPDSVEQDVITGWGRDRI
jgi:hypothetical protein